MIKNTIEIENNAHIYTRELDGITEVIQLANRITGNPENKNNSSMTGDVYFTGSDSLEQAIDLCENGWEEGVRKASSALTDVDLNDEVTQIRPIVDYIYDQAGDEPDIDRFISGEPEDMMTFYQDQASFGKTLSLKVNVAQHAYVEEERILLRGLVVTAAAGLIATAGYGLQIEAVEHITSGDNRLEYSIPIVKAGDYFNLDSVIFSLAHPSFLRRLLFAVEEQESDEIRDIFGIHQYGGYGMPSTIRLEPEDRSVVVDKNDYLIEYPELITSSASSLAKSILRKATEITNQ